MPNAHHLWNFDHVALSTYVRPGGRVNTPERLAAARAGARAGGRAALSMADVYRYGLEVRFTCGVSLTTKKIIRKMLTIPRLLMKRVIINTTTTSY